MKELEITEIRTLTKVLKESHDYDFSEYALSSFKRRVTRVLEIHKIQSVDELIKKLTLDRSYFSKFLSEITVNVTEMFRDPTCWIALRDKVIPEIRKHKKHIKIWHAACSSGEEVYSMMILLKEMGLSEDVSIVATDIDTQILEKAKQGVYSSKNIEINQRNYNVFNPQGDFQSYYSTSGDTMTINKNIIQNINFLEHNLVSDTPPDKFDLILCRNVLIYFNQVLQNQVLKKLHSGLQLGAYLGIGSKESLLWCDYIDKFTVIDKEDKIFKKIKD